MFKWSFVLYIVILHTEKAWNKFLYTSWFFSHVRKMIHLLRSYVSYFFTFKPYQGSSFSTFPGSILLFKPFGKFIKFHPQGCLLGQITYKRWVRKDVPLTRLLWRIMWNRKLAEKMHKRENKEIFENFQRIFALQRRIRHLSW